MLGVPVVVAAVVAIPLGLWRGGEYQWLCAGVAVGLVVPPGLATLVLAERMSRAFLFGPLLAVSVGTALRLAIGFGGAVVVFFACKPTFHSAPLVYWGWVLGVYLVTLVTETALLAGMRPSSKASGLPNA